MWSAEHETVDLRFKSFLAESYCQSFDTKCNLHPRKFVNRIESPRSKKPSLEACMQSAFLLPMR